MPKITKALTAIEVEIETRSTPKMHAVGTVTGLIPNIKTSVTNDWILGSPVGTRRLDIGLGRCSNVTLSTAIETAKPIKAKIIEGIDQTADRNA